MKFIEEIPSDRTILIENRNNYVENLLNELQASIAKNLLLEAYPKFLDMYGLFLNQRNMMADSHKENLTRLCQNYIAKIQETINPNENKGFHSLFIFVNFLSQWILDPMDQTLPLSDLAPKIRNRVEFFQGNFDKFKDVLTKEEQIEINFRLSHFRILTDKALSSDVIDFGTAMFDLGTKFYEYIKSQPPIHDKLGLAVLSMIFSTDMLEIGKVEVAETIANFGLEMAKDFGSSDTLLGCLQMVANCFRHRGKLDKAFEYFEKMISIEGLPYVSYAYPIRYIGYILQTRGEIDEALKHYKISLNLFECQDPSIDISRTPIARTLQNIAGIYYLKADFTKALEYSEKSLQINSTRQIKNPRFTVDLLYHKILTLLESDQIEIANEHFDQIKDLQEKHSNPIIDQLYNLTKALIFKRSKRIKQKAEAQNLLEKIVQGPILNHEYSIVAMQSLCDMLIDEMASDFDDETFNEAKNTIRELLKLAEDQQLHLVKVHTLLLQARFDIIQDNFEAGRLKINTAEEMCEKNTLNQLLEHVNKFKDKYVGEIDKWQTIVRNSSTLKERLANKEIQDYLKMALSAVTSDEI